MLLLFLLLLTNSLVVDIFGEVSDQALPLFIRVFNISDLKVLNVLILVFMRSDFKISAFLNRIFNNLYFIVFFYKSSFVVFQNNFQQIWYQRWKVVTVSFVFDVLLPWEFHERWLDFSHMRGNKPTVKILSFRSLSPLHSMIWRKIIDLILSFPTNLLL